MGWVDIAIAAVLVGCAIFGYRRGLMNQVVELAGLVAGLWLALYLTGGLVANYAKPLAEYRVTYPIVFLAIVAVALLVSQVVGRITGEVMQVTFFGWFDQVGGALAGVVKGALCISIWITIAIHMNLSPAVDDNLRKSSQAGPLWQLLPAPFDIVKTHAKDAPLQEPFRTETRQKQVVKRAP